MHRLINRCLANCLFKVFQLSVDRLKVAIFKLIQTESGKQKLSYAVENLSFHFMVVKKKVQIINSFSCITLYVLCFYIFNYDYINKYLITLLGFSLFVFILPNFTFQLYNYILCSCHFASLPMQRYIQNHLVLFTIIIYSNIFMSQLKGQQPIILIDSQWLGLGMTEQQICPSPGLVCPLTQITCR